MTPPPDLDPEGRTVELGAITAALLTLALVAATVWALPVLAQGQPGVVVEHAPLVAWLSGGGALSGLVAIAVSWGKNQARFTEHHRRLLQVEGCAAGNPQRVTALEAAQAERRKADDERHQELLRRFDRLDSRLASHTHGS